MPGPGSPYTKLDADQVIRQAFDETTDRLRVDAEVTATVGDMELNIDHTTDSVKVGDGTDLLAINPDGSIDVNVLGSGSSSTATVTSVASSASNVTLLSANAARLGVSIYNDSTQVLYIKLGTTASSTSFTVQLTSNGVYEVPFNYTGRIDGIWVSANGNARITELT